MQERPRSQLHLPQHPKCHLCLSRSTELVTNPLTPQRHCWRLFIPPGAGGAIGKPQP